MPITNRRYSRVALGATTKIRVRCRLRQRRGENWAPTKRCPPSLSLQSRGKRNPPSTFGPFFLLRSLRSFAATQFYPRLEVFSPGQPLSTQRWHPARMRIIPNVRWVARVPEIRPTRITLLTAVAQVIEFLADCGVTPLRLRLVIPPKHAPTVRLLPVFETQRRRPSELA